MINGFLALQKSFSAKIIVFLIVTMVCMAAIFDFVLITMQKKSYHSSLDAQGMTLTRMLAHSVRLAVFTENTDDMRDPVGGLLLQKDVVEVVIWNKDEKILLQKSKHPTGRLRVNPESMEIQTFLDNLDNYGHPHTENEDSFTYWGKVFLNISPDSEDNWYFDLETSDSEQVVIGYVTVVISKESFKEDVRNILIQTGISVLIFLCIGILVTFCIIRKVTEPLRDLMLTIRKKKDSPGTPDDLEMLAETYDSMIADLESSFETINELNKGLEDKVKHRTLLLTKANEELSQRQNKLESSNTKLFQALSRLKETQEQLIQQEKLAAMGQLIAGVAHEINNTVNFISGALPSLHRSLDEIKEVLSGYEEIEKARGSDILDEKFDMVRALKEELSYDELFSTIDQLMENIDEGTTRTTRIIRDLKTFSREDADKAIPLNLHAVIDSTINFIDKQLLQKITINRDYGSLPLVHCLPGRISQVFLNIMHNGIQAMDGQGQLTIKTEYRNERVHLLFSDTGCGITEDDMPKIFDPFFTNKEVGEGTGLGLGISYTIIRQHGGEINVQSEEGKGALFEIILPVEPVAIF